MRWCVAVVRSKATKPSVVALRQRAVGKTLVRRSGAKRRAPSNQSEVRQFWIPFCRKQNEAENSIFPHGVFKDVRWANLRRLRRRTDVHQPTVRQLHRLLHEAGVRRMRNERNRLRHPHVRPLHAAFLPEGRRICGALGMRRGITSPAAPQIAAGATAKAKPTSSKSLGATRSPVLSLVAVIATAKATMAPKTSTRVCSLPPRRLSRRQYVRIERSDRAPNLLRTRSLSTLVRTDTGVTSDPA